MKLFYCAIVLMCVAACSSIRSVQIADKNDISGLTYYMPKRDVLIKVTMADKNPSEISSIEITTTSPYPDTSKRYVLTHHFNLIGKNIADIGITPSGLLKSATSTTKNNISETLKALSSTVGSVGSLKSNKANDKSTSDCAAAMTHTFIYQFDQEKWKDEKPCGLKIDIKKLTTGNVPGDNSTKESASNKHSITAGDDASGIFYRQDEPYLVTVESDNDNDKVHVSSIVFSPSGSNTYFLPVKQTAFADNRAVIELDDGVPTKYVEDTDSELLAILKLPAEVIAAYFGAVGEVFTNFKSADSSQSEAMSESIKLELVKRKYELCLDAIRNNKTDVLDDLGCKNI